MSKPKVVGKLVLRGILLNLAIKLFPDSFLAESSALGFHLREEKETPALPLTIFVHHPPPTMNSMTAVSSYRFIRRLCLIFVRSSLLGLVFDIQSMKK